LKWGAAMNLTKQVTVEKTGFKVVCDACGSLSIKQVDPASPAAANVLCGRCNAVRGTLAELQDLARQGKDVFEF
jgi:hypothetical protein